jgi:hypothetical protein
MRGDGFKTALIYAACAALTGFAAAYIMCALLTPFIAAETASLQETLALEASKRQPGIFHARSQSSGGETAGVFSFFGVPEDAPAEEAETPEEPESVEELTLAGTIPNIGAWLEAKDGVKFVPRGESLKGYKLEQIERDSAVLSRGGKNITLFLTFWTPPEKRARASAPAAGANQPPARRPPPAIPSRVQSASRYNVKQADPDGADGTISRETLNELLSNPLAEIGNMRLVPSDNGMIVKAMRDDSLFAKMGMKPDDVITNVNGIGISDVGNFSNVMSSLLAGTRFDFQIERGGEPMKLGYAVE